MIDVVCLFIHTVCHAVKYEYAHLLKLWSKYRVLA
jgi:hypothetical protein